MDTLNVPMGPGVFKAMTLEEAAARWRELKSLAKPTARTNEEARQIGWAFERATLETIPEWEQCQARKALRALNKARRSKKPERKTR